MKNGKSKNTTEVLYFKRWSRKSYAIACSIGKVVHIGVLALHISQRLDEKCGYLKRKLQLQHLLSANEEKDLAKVVDEAFELFLFSLVFLLTFKLNFVEEQEGSFRFQLPFLLSFLYYISLSCIFFFIDKSCRSFFSNIFYRIKINQDES